MAEESFMLLSLKEGQSKKLAQVISNDTSRQILDFLANKEFATETQISKDTKIPLSTVHYNIKALRESGLIVDEEFHYSEKGKEVPHYKLAKKFIIIAPKDEKSVMDKIKRFFPVTALATVAAGALHLLQKSFGWFSWQVVSPLMLGAQDTASRAVFSEQATRTLPAAAPVLADSADIVLEESAHTLGKMTADPTLTGANSIIQTVVTNASNTSQNISDAGSALAHNSSLLPSGDIFTSPTSFYEPVALWFLAGAFFVLLTLVIWELVKQTK